MDISLLLQYFLISCLPFIIIMDLFRSLFFFCQTTEKPTTVFTKVTINRKPPPTRLEPTPHPPCHGSNLRSTDAIKAMILDVVSAGTDTTFTNLEWTISDLLRHPETMKRLQHEAREIGLERRMITEEDLLNMPYLKAVIKESLRLHTPVPLLVAHELTQEIKLLGYDIASGTQVMINAWEIARDSSTWEEPEEFRLERFLDSHIDYKGLHFELIPFGVVRRRCPAIQFPMAINELVLANLVYNFYFVLTSVQDLDMSETTSLTVHKKYPILVVATPC